MPSLSEYMAQSNRGLNQSVFGPEYLSKAFNAANTGTADAIEVAKGLDLLQRLEAYQTSMFQT